MANNNTFIKKQKEQLRKKKKAEKEERKVERQKNAEGKTFDDMIAYVDENGNLSSTPIEKKVVPTTK